MSEAKRYTVVDAEPELVQRALNKLAVTTPHGGLAGAAYDAIKTVRLVTLDEGTIDTMSEAFDDANGERISGHIRMKAAAKKLLEPTP